MTDQLLTKFHAGGQPTASRVLIVPLSDDGWTRIDEIMECIPGLPLAQLIEKALVLAWAADDAELV